MSSHFTIVLNPVAARGRSAGHWPRVEDALKQLGVSYDLVPTGAPGEATAIARASRSPAVVAAGGDGTVSEVVNGILGTGKRLGVIPMGSGNDFIKSLGIPHDPVAASRILVKGIIRSVDVGRAYVKLAETELSQYFCNGIGVGFDAEVAIRTSAVQRFSGTGVYVVAVLKTLGSYAAPEFSIRVDGVTLRGPKLLVAVGNGPCAGGGFYLTPKASVTDGLLDLCAVEAMGTISILRLMPKVMRSAHLTMPQVRYLQGKSIEIESETGFSVHADGEILARQAARNVHLDVEEGALDVFVSA